ncbi:MAG: alpha/beta fold hydrolase, partial [Candidatus Thiodiazotropha sp.]
MKKLFILFFGILAIYLSASQAQNIFNSGDPEHKEIVVLLHGLARSNAAMWLLNMRLKHAGYHVETVGYRSLNRTPQQIVDDISQQIDLCSKGKANKIHFVGHSLGGLLIRAYLQNSDVRNLGRVVLVGTPNQGTEVADHFKDKWWAKIAGPTALSLGTGEGSFPKTLDDPYYPVGVIAGVSQNDNDHILPGLDDGLVSVESTKVNNMNDFVIVYSGHSMMRYNEDVADQTIH